jgi:hypothetical protein
MPTTTLLYGALGCLAWVLFVLLVRGADDWSDLLGVTFYGAVVVGPILGILGGVAAVYDRSLATWKRVVAIVVGVVLPVLAVALIVLIVVALSQLE